MKIKNQPKPKKKLTSKKSTDNIKITNFFSPKEPEILNSNKNNNNFFTAIKKNTKHITPNKQRCYLMRNPSKTRILGEIREELLKYHDIAESTILIDKSQIKILCNKLHTSFKIIHEYLIKQLKIIPNIKNINEKKNSLYDFFLYEIIIKFLLQLKNVNIVYVPEELLSEVYNSKAISQCIRNLIGYDSLKQITINSYPNTEKECEILMPKITKIIKNYLNNFHGGKGLYIYVEHDYLYYLKIIKLLCNLFNYEISVIEETNQAKYITLDKLSEAMRTKRLPSIPEQLDVQMLMLEEMVNSASYKWKIFIKEENEKKEKNSVIKNENNNIKIDNSIIKNYCNILATQKTKNANIENYLFKKNNNNEVKNECIKQYFQLDDDSKDSKEDLSTSDANYLNIKKNKNNINSKFIDKSKEKNSKNNIKSKSRSRSDDKKRRKNRKNRKSSSISDTEKNNNINFYFQTNTKEHKIFQKLQNNVYTFCSKAKTAIVISDSFTSTLTADVDKKYFNNIINKITQTKCPVIVVTNNLEHLYNLSIKKQKSLNINCFLSTKNKREDILIYLYNFVIYTNIKLNSIKYTKKIKKYEHLKNYINNITILDSDLNNENLKKINELSQFFCYKGKFQIDIIDLRLTEIFNETEIYVIENNENNFSNILNYIYAHIFNKTKLNKNSKKEKLEDIYNFCELNSFMDYNDGIEKNLVNKIFYEKLKINDSAEEYHNSKEDRVNMEKLILEQYFLKNDNKINSIKNIMKKYSKNYININFLCDSNFFEILDNKTIHKIHKEDQLFLSMKKKKFITLSLLPKYTFLTDKIINFKIKEKKNGNCFNNIFNVITEEIQKYMDIHNENIFAKINGYYFLNKNLFYYATNYWKKNSISKKISTKFDEYHNEF